MATEVTRAVLFADLAGYTALTEAHGDRHALDSALRFAALAEACLHESARVVKTIGDAVMVVAPDAPTGLDIALSLMRCVDAEPDFPGIRAGLHVGVAIEAEDDIYGATVNLAARLTERAHVGQLVATQPVAEHASTVPNVTVNALGPTRLKNVSEPIELFRIERADHTSRAQVLDPVCRMYVDAEDAPGRLPWNGRIWSFCSLECASSFLADPQRYEDR